MTAEFKGGASVPIGRPINNMRCYVLDPQLQLLPVGMAGELMVSGIQLAREYLDNPGKTAASFIQNPHNQDNHPNHTRVYRTGPLSAAGWTASHVHMLAQCINSPWLGTTQGRRHRLACCPAGDLARWLPSGNVEFLGRLDDQVSLT